MRWTLTVLTLRTPAIALLHCLLFAVLVRSAPVSVASDPPPAFREAAERAKTLVHKILGDLPAVHTAIINTEGLTFNSPTQTANLQMMMSSLGIPAAPVLKPLCEDNTLDTCVSHMLVGGHLYQRLLGVLSERLSGLGNLQVDLRDLLTHINKMKEAAQLSSTSTDQDKDVHLSSHLHGNYEVQVAAHLTLTQLRSFCRDLIRSLRAVSTPRPRTASSQ